MLRKKLLLIILLIIGCATKAVENRTSTEYTMKMSEDEKNVDRKERKL